MMSLNLYEDIIKTIEGHKIRDCQDVLEAKYPTINTLTLGSLLSNYVQKKMKQIHSKHNTPEMIQKYYARYLDAVEKEESGIILRLSDEILITPVLVARFILEAYLRQLQEERQEDEVDYETGNSTPKADENDARAIQARSRLSYNFSNIRGEVTKLLRNTTLIENKTLAYEVHLCLVHDDHYGPCPDVIKRTVGAEYEDILKRRLEELQVSYFDERQLRQQGYDKTPDFRLDVPIAIEGRVVNWIESKATFGDEETHQTYMNEQLTSYFNRFGPGLVIYWLGYVETLESRTTKGIFVRDHMPTAITKMDPTLVPVPVSMSVNAKSKPFSSAVEVSKSTGVFGTSQSFGQTAV